MRAASLALAAMLLPGLGRAASPAIELPGSSGNQQTVVTPATGTRTGLDIYRRFRDGLAEPDCRADASTRWQAHFAHAPAQLAAAEGELLPLFGYVVDAVREAHLPTEFALIPFVESGYKPGARSAQGPAGLWQMIALTARNHKVPMRPGYDGRLSPIDSTTAAVRYLKTLHGMFAGDWRLAVMAYNAGEYRVLGALKRGGQVARNAKPENLPGLSPITHAYVRKLHALSCLMEQAEDREEWLKALDRPVPVLRVFEIPAGISDIGTWARRNTQDAARLRRLNPVYAEGRLASAGTPRRLLAPAPATSGDAEVALAALEAPGEAAGASGTADAVASSRPAPTTVTAALAGPAGTGLHRGASDTGPSADAALRLDIQPSPADAPARPAAP